SEVTFAQSMAHQTSTKSRSEDAVVLLSVRGRVCRSVSRMVRTTGFKCRGLVHRISRPWSETFGETIQAAFPVGGCIVARTAKRVNGPVRVFWSQHGCAGRTR